MIQSTCTNDLFLNLAPLFSEQEQRCSKKERSHVLRDYIVSLGGSVESGHVAPVRADSRTSGKAGESSSRKRTAPRTVQPDNSPPAWQLPKMPTLVFGRATDVYIPPVTWRNPPTQVAPLPPPSGPLFLGGGLGPPLKLEQNCSAEPGGQVAPLPPPNGPLFLGGGLAPPRKLERNCSAEPGGQVTPLPPSSGPLFLGKKAETPLFSGENVETSLKERNCGAEPGGKVAALPPSSGPLFLGGKVDPPGKKRNCKAEPRRQVAPLPPSSGPLLWGGRVGPPLKKWNCSAEPEGQIAPLPHLSGPLFLGGGVEGPLTKRNYSAESGGEGQGAQKATAVRATGDLKFSPESSLSWIKRWATFPPSGQQKVAPRDSDAALFTDPFTGCNVSDAQGGVISQGGAPLPQRGASFGGGFAQRSDWPRLLGVPEEESVLEGGVEAPPAKRFRFDTQTQGGEAKPMTSFSLPGGTPSCVSALGGLKAYQPGSLTPFSVWESESGFRSLGAPLGDSSRSRKRKFGGPLDGVNMLGPVTPGASTLQRGLLMKDIFGLGSTGGDPSRNSSGQLSSAARGGTSAQGLLSSLSSTLCNTRESPVAGLRPASTGVNREKSGLTAETSGLGPATSGLKASTSGPADSGLGLADSGLTGGMPAASGLTVGFEEGFDHPAAEEELFAAFAWNTLKQRDGLQLALKGPDSQEPVSNPGVMSDGEPDSADLAALVTEHLQNLLDEQAEHIKQTWASPGAAFGPDHVLKLREQHDQIRSALAFLSSLTGLPNPPSNQASNPSESDRVSERPEGADQTEELTATSSAIRDGAQLERGSLTALMQDIVSDRSKENPQETLQFTDVVRGPGRALEGPQVRLGSDGFPVSAWTRLEDPGLSTGAPDLDSATEYQRFLAQLAVLPGEPVEQLLLGLGQGLVIPADADGLPSPYAPITPSSEWERRFEHCTLTWPDETGVKTPGEGPFPLEASGDGSFAGASDYLYPGLGCDPL
jgi:hypothetical protein